MKRDYTKYFTRALAKNYLIALDETGEEFSQIRLICLEVVLDYVRPKNKVQAFLKRLPAKLINTWFAKAVLRSFQKRVDHNANAAGFVAHINTDKKRDLWFWLRNRHFGLWNLQAFFETQL